MTTMHSDRTDFFTISIEVETADTSLGNQFGSGHEPYQIDPEQYITKKKIVVESRRNHHVYTYSYVHRRIEDFPGDVYHIHETHVYLNGDTILEYEGYVRLGDCMRQIQVSVNRSDSF